MVLVGEIRVEIVLYEEPHIRKATPNPGTGTTSNALQIYL